MALLLQQLGVNIRGLGDVIFAPSHDLEPLASITLPVCETDFVVIENQTYPDKAAFIIGECKDEGDRIDEKDIDNLRQIANAIPSERFDPYILLARLSPFSLEEIALARTLNSHFQERVILLSQRELEPYHVYERVNKERGTRYHGGTAENIGPHDYRHLLPKPVGVLAEGVTRRLRGRHNGGLRFANPPYGLPLRPGKIDERPKIVMVGFFQSIDISAPSLALTSEIGAAPAIASAAQSGDQQIRRQARPASVAVRKGMHEHGLVVEANSQFVRLVGFVLDPEARVVDRLNQFGLNEMRQDAKIAFRLAVFAGPAPHLVEHAAVQTEQESFVEHVAFALERPGVRLGDVLLLKLVQLAAQRDVRRNERLALGRSDRRGVIVGFERAFHFHPKAAPGG